MVEISFAGLLFDLDGVLADSTPAVARVWSAWAIEHGLEPEEIIRRAHGRPSIATIREFLPDGDHEGENLKVEQAEISDVADVVALPGARELLHSLPKDRWAIVTSCTRALAEVRLKAAGLPARHLVTSDDIVHGKPSPEPYLKGAALLGVPATECIVFEDAPAGVRAGKAAGALVVAFTTTAPGAELEDAGADWIVSGCESISTLKSDCGLDSIRLQRDD